MATSTRTAVINYIVGEYFGGDVAKAAAASGYSENKLGLWLSGLRVPQKKSIEYLVHCVFTPEFRIVAEYAPFDPEQPILGQLRSMLEGHEKRPGIYAFYDSMANLLYVGKATNLLDETYQQIRKSARLVFPKGVKTKPEHRYQIVRYVSAYDVGVSNWLDYPKHVEALLLRISKPPLNSNIGFLSKIERPNEDT